MSKPSMPRRLTESEAKAVASNLRVSPRKLNLVAASIRGKAAQPALAVLTFSKRRIANAENNHQLDVDRLYVAEAFVGRSFVMKRFHARARGRGAPILKPWSNLTVVVREREETA